MPSDTLAGTPPPLSTGAAGLAVTLRSELPQPVYFRFGGTSAEGTVGGAPISADASYGGFTGAFDELIQLERWDSGRLLISLGSPLSVAAPPFTPDAAGPDIPVRWDKVELSLSPDAGAVSVANLSAQDFFGLRLRIDTYAPDATTPTTTLGWSASTPEVLTGLVTLSGGNRFAVASGPGGVPVEGVGDVVRVVNPSSVSGASDGAGYASFADYLDAMKGQPPTIVQGAYAGLGSDEPPDRQAQSYRFEARVLDDGTLELLGEGDRVGATTIRLAEEDLLTPAGIYGANPASTVNGEPHANTNSVYDAAIRDTLGGFNLGLVGSAATNPNTGHAYRDDPTAAWYASPLPPENAFGNAQPERGDFYNQFAAFLAPITDAYGFAYTDLVKGTFADINPSRTDRVVITVLGDEPAEGASFLAELPGGGLAAASRADLDALSV